MQRFVDFEMGMQRLSGQQFCDIAFEANWPAYEDALDRINPERYRGLGDARKKQFARLAFADARALGINTVGGVCWYLIPCSWLGLHFRHDPRYAEIGRALSGQDDDGTEEFRLEKAREIFCWIAQNTSGLQGERLPEALHRAHNSFSWLFDVRMTPDRVVDVLLDAFSVSSEFRRYFPKEAFVQTCLSEAHMADLRGLDAHKVHVSIAFWLGAGFLRDPQFSWGRDTIEDAIGRQGDPVQALARYAEKRLRRMLTRIDGVG